LKPDVGWHSRFSIDDTRLILINRKKS
jgi:hypothetical protein